MEGRWARRRTLGATLACTLALAGAPASAQLPPRDVGPSVVRPPEPRGSSGGPGWRTPPDPAAPAPNVPTAPGAPAPPAPPRATPNNSETARPASPGPGAPDARAPEIAREEPEVADRGRRGRRGRERGRAEHGSTQPVSREWLAQLGPFALEQLCERRFVELGRDYLNAIAAAVQPVGPQRGRMDELARSMERASGVVLTTCTGDVAVTPPGQFEAIDRRLESVLTAVRGVRAAMDGLWSSLDDEQKARLNTVGLQFERGRRAGRPGRRGRIRF